MNCPHSVYTVSAGSLNGIERSRFNKLAFLKRNSCPCKNKTVVVFSVSSIRNVFHKAQLYFHISYCWLDRITT